MKQSFITTIAGLLPILLLLSCSSTDTPEPVTCPVVNIELSRAEQEVVANNNNFTFNLLKVMDYNRNFVVSPLSLSTNLSLLANACEGDTRAEILEALGIENANLQLTNKVNARLKCELPVVDTKTALSLSNSLWLDKGTELSSDFKNACASYDTDLFNVVLSENSTLNKINSWTNEKTKGYIEKLLSAPLDFNTSFALINALYFNGQWAESFNSSETKAATFYNADGSESTVEMMNSSRTIFCGVNKNVTYIRLPFGNGAYNLVAMMPTENENLDKVIESLDKIYADISEADQSGMCKLSLPRFEIYDSSDMKDLLKKIGIQLLFSTKSNLTGFTSAKTLLGTINQTTRIAIDEKGAVATGATIASGMYTDNIPTVEFEFNRPFLFLISEKSTSAILFAGYINSL